MSETKAFLSDKAARCDLVMLEIIGITGPQSFRARVQQVYSTRKGVRPEWLGSEIEFVGSPSHWGQASLSVGDTALVFLKQISGKLYEDAWHGHMVVEKIDGVSYAIFEQRELWLSKDIPASIRDVSRQDPKRADRSAVRLDVLETYLVSLL